MPLKRDATDAAFSDAIRESYDWVCVRCQYVCHERKGQEFHCSHFFSRKFNSTRYFPDNALALCASCHAIVGDDPGEHTHILMQDLGPVRYDELRIRKRQIVRYRKAEKKEMREHYRNEIRLMKEARRNGIIGYIELVPYD